MGRDLVQFHDATLTWPKPPGYWTLAGVHGSGVAGLPPSFQGVPKPFTAGGAVAVPGRQEPHPGPGTTWSPLEQGRRFAVTN